MRACARRPSSRTTRSAPMPAGTTSPWAGIRSTGLSAALGIAAPCRAPLQRRMGVPTAPLADPVWPRVPNISEAAAARLAGSRATAASSATANSSPGARSRPRCPGPLAARSLAGLKRRTRVTMGRCQGFYCSAELARITAGAFRHSRWRRRPMTADLPTPRDVVIVGAGPAGSAGGGRAARQARRAASSSSTARRAAGGIPRHCGHSPYGLREFRRLMLGPAYAARAGRRGRGSRGRRHPHRHHGHGAPSRPAPVASPPTPGTGEIAARLVLLATGVRETTRAAPPDRRNQARRRDVDRGASGPRLPGDGLRPFRRPVILGTELVAFSAILTCRHAGIRPVAMVEPGPRHRALAPRLFLPRLLGIALLTGTEIVAIEGRTTVEGVVAAPTRRRDPRPCRRRCDRHGRLSTRGGACARPATLPLTRQPAGRRSTSSAAALTRPFSPPATCCAPVETAGWCWAEGRAVARAMLRSLAGRAAGCNGAVAGSGRGGALGYACRSVWPADPAPAALPNLHLRVTRPVTWPAAGQPARRAIAWPHAIDSRPERRILVPLPTAGDGDIRADARRELAMNILAIDQGTTSTRAFLVDRPAR